MKKIKSILLAAGCIAVLSLSSGNVAAQGRGNFDPAQMRQMMLDRFKDQFEVTDDAEWKVLEGAIGKVFDAQREVMAGAMRGFGPGGGGRRNRNNNNGGDTNTNNGDNAQNRRPRGGFGTPSAEAEALQKAIEEKAPADDIKAKLAKLREVNATNQAKLTAAQEDLKKLLTSRQEAVAVLNGLLK